jgi:two-component system chemotaxis response regulator CheY
MDSRVVGCFWDELNDDVENGQINKVRTMAVNILVVDDSGVMRSMIAKTIKLSGLVLGEIQQAANGQEGLEALSQHWIDLVIVDINMPVMNGEEMIDKMLEQPELKDIPIVVISTEGSQTRVERLQDKGARFIHKPFTPEAVRDTVKELLGDGVFDGTAN